ncbi:hypothetical protein K7432_001933 [Basidiobolus ranarum]|uniref:Cyclin-like domain-containing protein n=1 Tax=Basidiobolus ranarum TaxID=34480 RepID=A0ABR2W8Q8_9FUNG
MTSYPLHWYFKKGEPIKTPSSLDGIDCHKEKLDRSKGCTLIFSIGMTLELPQITLATATVYFHRFYLRQSLKEFHYYDIGTTCVFLACKVEETRRNLQDIITVYAQKVHKLILEENSKEFCQWKEMIFNYEVILLETLCFELTIEHPYKILIRLVQELQGSKKVANIAWALINHSLRTVLCITYPPHVVAASAFYIANKLLDSKLDTSTECSWWKIIDVNFKDVKDASVLLLDQC